MGQSDFHHAATVILALSGRQIFAKRAVERISENIKALPEDQLSKGKMQDAIEAALRHIFENQVYTHPDWGTDEAPDFEFMTNSAGAAALAVSCTELYA